MTRRPNESFSITDGREAFERTRAEAGTDPKTILDDRKALREFHNWCRDVRTDPLYDLTNLTRDDLAKFTQWVSQSNHIDTIETLPYVGEFVIWLEQQGYVNQGIHTALTVGKSNTSNDSPNDDDHRFAGRDRIQYEVVTIPTGTVQMEFDASTASSLEHRLDEATTILACTECGDLAPVSGGLPRSMPNCPICGKPMEGVLEVHRLTNPD